MNKLIAQLNEKPLKHRLKKKTAKYYLAFGGFLRY